MPPSDTSNLNIISFITIIVNSLTAVGKKTCHAKITKTSKVFQENKIYED